MRVQTKNSPVLGCVGGGLMLQEPEWQWNLKSPIWGTDPSKHQTAVYNIMRKDRTMESNHSVKGKQWWSGCILLVTAAACWTSHCCWPYVFYFLFFNIYLCIYSFSFLFAVGLCGGNPTVQIKLFPSRYFYTTVITNNTGNGFAPLSVPVSHDSDLACTTAGPQY